MALLVVFGSVWMHGILPVEASAHTMMPDAGVASCLNKCLEALHIDLLDHFVVPAAPVHVVPAAVIETVFVPAAEDASAAYPSHHDPWRILTTIKRE